MIDLKEPPKNFLKNNQHCTYKKVDVTDFNKLKKSIDIFYKKNKQIDYLINTTGVLWFDKDVSVCVGDAAAIAATAAGPLSTEFYA